MKKDQLFIPLDGVIIEIEKKENLAGIEIAGNSTEKNEGIILNDIIHLTKKTREEFGNEVDLVNMSIRKGKKVKFTEGFNLGDNLYFVKLDKIIGNF